MRVKSDRWYVRDAGRITGPFKRVDLENRCLRGELDWFHEVSRDRVIWVSALTITNPGVGDAEPGSEKGASGPAGPRRKVMAVGLIGLAAVGIAWVGWAALDEEGKAAQAAQDAIARVIEQSDEAARSMKEVLVDQQKYAVKARAIDLYVARMRSLELSDCPSDFRDAFSRYLDSCERLGEGLRALPEGSLEEFIEGFRNGFRFQELDGGLSRMNASIRKAAERVETDYQQVEELARKYGVGTS